MTATFTLTDAQAWVIVIAALGGVIVSIINALKSRENGAKLDVIHTLTNSNLTAVKADLTVARSDIAFLKEFISKNVTPPEPDPGSDPKLIAHIELAPTAPVEPSPFPVSPFPPTQKP